MISSLDLNFDVLSEMLGIVVEQKDTAPLEGEPLKLYIPVLMPSIDKSIPISTKKYLNKGTRLFLNSNDCRPTSKVLLNIQNYITGYLEKNSEWIDETCVNGNEKVECYAPNGKLSKLLFNTDMYFNMNIKNGELG